MIADLLSLEPSDLWRGIWIALALVLCAIFVGGFAAVVQATLGPIGLRFKLRRFQSPAVLEAARTRVEPCGGDQRLTRLTAITEYPTRASILQAQAAARREREAISQQTGIQIAEDGSIVPAIQEPDSFQGLTLVGQQGRGRR